MRIADNTKVKLNEEDAKRSAKFLHEMFTSLKFPYWMDYGTLLGIVRNKAFILYDTDIECYVLVKDNIDKAFILTYLDQHGFKFEVDFNYRYGVTIKDRKGYIHMSFGWFKYHPILSKLIPKKLFIILGRRYVHSTSEIIRPFEGGKREKRKLNNWIRSFLPLVFCSGIKTVPFYDFEVCIPSRAEELLEIRYGKDWRIPKQRYESYTT